MAAGYLFLFFSGAQAWLARTDGYGKAGLHACGMDQCM